MLSGYNFGTLVVALKVHFVYISGTFGHVGHLWGHLRYILGTFWVRFGVLIGYAFGNILGSILIALFVAQVQI